VGLRLCSWPHHLLAQRRRPRAQVRYLAARRRQVRALHRQLLGGFCGRYGLELNDRLGSMLEVCHCRPHVIHLRVKGRCSMMDTAARQRCSTAGPEFHVIIARRIRLVTRRPNNALNTNRHSTERKIYKSAS